MHQHGRDIGFITLHVCECMYFCYCFAKYPTCTHTQTYTQSNAYFAYFAIEWKYEIAHSVRIDNWNRVIYNQTLFAFAYLYFSASERQTERKKPHSMHHPEFCVEFWARTLVNANAQSTAQLIDNFNFWFLLLFSVLVLFVWYGQMDVEPGKLSLHVKWCGWYTSIHKI